MGYVNIPGGALSSGLILMWHGLIANIPGGWVLCDGTNSTPDLRAAFVRGAPAATEAGTTGGADTHTLNAAELPAHYHNCGTAGGSGSIIVGTAASGTGTANTKTTGNMGNAAHNNMPAYYEVLYIMKS